MDFDHLGRRRRLGDAKALSGRHDFLLGELVAFLAGFPNVNHLHPATGKRCRDMDQTTGGDLTIRRNFRGKLVVLLLGPPRGLHVDEDGHDEPPIAGSSGPNARTF